MVSRLNHKGSVRMRELLESLFLENEEHEEQERERE